MTLRLRQICLVSPALEPAVGRGEGLVAIDIRVAKPGSVLDAAAAMGASLGSGVLSLCGIHVQLSE